MCKTQGFKYVSEVLNIQDPDTNIQTDPPLQETGLLELTPRIIWFHSNISATRENLQFVLYAI